MGNKNNKLGIWKAINELQSKSSKRTSISMIKNKNDDIIINPLDLSNEFNNNFINMGKNLAEKITPDVNYKMPKKRMSHSFYLSHTNETEIKEVIEDLKNKKAPGYDNIKAETLKQIAHYIAEPLSFLMNLIIDTGEIPSNFKISVVKPIYKKGDKLTTTNYRPISLITSFAKIFEKVIKQRVWCYLKKYKIISKQQYGFQEGISTQNAIAHLIKRIYQDLDDKKPSLAIFLDLAKAFDTVSFPLLIESLEDIGIRGLQLDLFRNYLEKRTQFVSLNGILSTPGDISYGVPQGTVLGPLLFIIYINNLFLVETAGDIVTFADDTVVYYNDVDWTTLKCKVQDDFPKIKNWFNNKLLTLNVGKTFFVPFSSYKINLPNFDTLQIHENGETFEIHSTTSVNYLGINIDNHLKWDTHIAFIMKKMRSLIHLFYKSRSFLQENDLITLYKVMVAPHLSYGIIAWGGVLKTHLLPLENLQKRFFKIILRKPRMYPSEKLSLEIKLFDLRQTYFYNVSTYMYQNPIQFEAAQYCRYDTRTRNTFLVPLMKKTVGQRSFIYLGPKMINSLPFQVTDIHSIKKFKHLLKKFVLENKIKIEEIIDTKNS